MDAVPAQIAQPPKTPKSASSAGLAAVLQSMLVRVLILLTNALTGIITARALAPHGRGELSAMILWPALVSNCMTLGLPKSLTYNLRRQPQDSVRFVETALMLGTFISCIAGGVVALLMPSLLRQYDPTIVTFARWFLVSTPMGILLVICRGTFEAEGQFGVSNFSQWLPPTLTLIGLGILLGFHKLTPFTAALVYVPNSLPVLAWMLLRLRHLWRFSFASNMKAAKTLLSYGLRCYGIDLCGTLAVYVDQVLVVGFLRPDAMGIYSIALSASRMLNLCQASVVMVIFPKAVGRKAGDVVSCVGRVARVSTIVTAFLAASIIFIGPWALRTFYGKDYTGASVILDVLTVEVTLGGLTSVLAQAGMALGRPGIVTTLQCVGLAVTVPLMLVFVPRYGVVGAAISLLVSTCCRLVFILLSFRLFLNCERPGLLPARSDFSFVVSHLRPYLERFRRNGPIPMLLSEEESI